MPHADLRAFIADLEQRGLLKRIAAEVDPNLEMTELADRVLRTGGPALLFENPKGYKTPCSPTYSARSSGWRSAWAARRWRTCARSAACSPSSRNPSPQGPEGSLAVPAHLQEGTGHGTKTLRSAPCQEIVLEGDAINLAHLPIQTCWPEDAGPLITWGLVHPRARASHGKTWASTACR